MTEPIEVRVQFYALSGALQPYFTALYSFEIDCLEGARVDDWLHPEWATMRFTQSGRPPDAGVIPEATRPTFPFVVSGPTSRAIGFTLWRSRLWGLGLQPAGWARYVRLHARELADRIVDGSQVQALAHFAPILDIVRQQGVEADAIARQINSYLLQQDVHFGPPDPMVERCHEVLRDPAVGDVEELGRRLGMNRRSLERFCARHFGFAPKKLLRRQRFLRSLARFMVLPPADGSGRSWSSALDEQYFDHAHFVRDFRSFMGMTPTDYADTPHPVLDRIMARRMVDQGVLPQTDMPTVLRYADGAGVAG
ncbi:helix-turn-helix domain-containing protein [Alteraurantiacibacter palmitatis]|uniref:Helix-turn-helix domain-containing protein n=1 Tax=Alteraurantiacibacter palmitatis TaxID=2054628 RepID=A0ABV7E482_9SPHN